MKNILTYNSIALLLLALLLPSVIHAATLDKSAGNRITDGLVGYWTFDGKDINSTVNDVSGQGRNGYLRNFQATSTITAPGKVGQALKFGGSTNAGMLVSSSDIIGTGDFSACLWMYATSNNGSTDYIINNGQFILRHAVANKFAVVVSGSGGLQSTTNAIVLNQWQHICVTRDSTGFATFYINGNFLNSGSAGTNGGGTAV